MISRTDISDLTLGEFVRSHAPTLQITLLTEKPPKSRHTAYVDMTIDEFTRDCRPDHFRQRGGAGRELVEKLKALLLRELGKVW